MDLIPGIYTPDVYKERLDQFQMLMAYVNFAQRFPARGGRTDKPTPPPTRDQILHDYHARQADLLKANLAPDVLVRGMDRGKMMIENPIKMMAAADAAKLRKAAPTKAPAPAAKPATKAEEIARWEALTEDTKLNETVRREMIHRKLADAGSVKPDQIVKWLYKDVLHADLDDPYLGLGEVLFKNYPFAEEDAGTSAVRR
jgi:hypothetical protein